MISIQLRKATYRIYKQLNNTALPRLVNKLENMAYSLRPIGQTTIWPAYTTAIAAKLFLYIVLYPYNLITEDQPM